MASGRNRLFVVTGCTECPNCDVVRTPGAGDALDYRCKAVQYKGSHRVIAGYVESGAEKPKIGQFPVWCPLRVTNHEPA